MSRQVIAEHATLNVFGLDLSRTYSYQLLSIGSGHEGMALRVHDAVVARHVYHQLAVTQTADGWCAQVILDI